MSRPNFEPPDPELWAKVIATCYNEHGKQVCQLCEEPPNGGYWWWLTVGSPEQTQEYEGIGNTWNDAARALIAEWEGRSKS
jgi:hypothetical protein